MESGKIEDSALSASSEYDRNHAASRARLNLQAGPVKKGAWSTASNDQSQWLQVDLKTDMELTGIATQGRNEHAQWVTSYKLQHSNNEDSFAFYQQQEQQADKVCRIVLTSL